MAASLACPGCKAELVLPALPHGQTVQCPRCQHVFEPGHAPPPMPAKAFASRAVPLPDLIDDDVAAESRPLSRYEPLRHWWKAPAAMFLLAACVVSYALELYVHFEQSQVFQVQQQFGIERFEFIGGRKLRPPIDARIAEVDRRWHNAQDLAGTSQALNHLIFWPTMIFVVVWFHQAARNLRILKAAGLMYVPSLAALSFFIPIINFFQPFSVMQEIWRASDPRVAGSSRSWQQAPYSITARIWWLTFLAAGALSLYAFWIGRDIFLDNADGLAQARVRMLSNLCMIGAGVALIVLIRGIQVRQRERHARVYDEAA